MARRVFLSFLGTNGYLTCNYYFNGNDADTVENVRFIQEALFAHECKDWKNPDVAYVFLTVNARKENWHDSSFAKNGEDALAGIQEGNPKLGLETCLKKRNFPFEVVPVFDVEEGFTEKDIWCIFNKINSLIEEGDEVYFDITHGFRSLPMLGIVLLNYLKSIKNITIGKIYYGAFEKLGPAYLVKKIPLKNRNAPVLDLQSFNNIMNFSYGANVFIKYGNGELLNNAILEWIKPRLLMKDPFALKLGDLRCLTASITQCMQTCRGAKICEGAIFANLDKWIDENTSEIQDNASSYQALGPVLSKIKEKYKGFSAKEDVLNGFRAAQWCFENSMYQQSITLLQEFIVTYLTKKAFGECCDVPSYRVLIFRSVIEEWLLGYGKALDDGCDKPRWKITLQNLLESGKILQAISERAEMYLSDCNLEYARCFTELSTLRNDVNHAGFLLRKLPKDPNNSTAKSARGIIDSLKIKIETISLPSKIAFPIPA